MSQHRGVKFLEVGDRVVARWRDPVSGKQVQKDMAPLGLTNARKRRLWAIGKAKELAKLKEKPVGARVKIEKSHADYLARFANENTRSAKVSALRSFEKFMTGRKLRDVQDVTPGALHEWAEHIRRPASEHIVSTQNWHLAVVGAWLRSCHLAEQTPRLSLDDIKVRLRRRKPPDDPIEVLQPAQIRALLASCIAHDEAHREQVAPLVLVILGSGMRYSEAEGLTWDEIDLEQQAIRLAANRTKTKRHRVITMAEAPAAMDVLRALRLRGGKGRVFPHITRGIAENLRRRTMADYSAPTWDWHTLRRTCGSLLVCGGVHGAGGPLIVADRLGHTLQIAQNHYLKAYVGLPKDCRTVEQAGGFEAEARAIVRAVAGVEAQAVAQ